MASEPDNIRRRSACDRCHSQKLRCPRRPGVDVCDRCAKARASCVYSPFRQKTIVKDPPEPSALPPPRHERHHPYSRDSLGELGGKRKRTGPQHLGHHGIYAPIQHDPLILDTMGLGLDWPSSNFSNFGDLELDTSFDGFNFDTVHGAQPLNTLYTTSDSSGVSDTPSPASYEASDGLPAMPFTFEPLQAFQLESPTSSIQAFDNINFTPQVDQEHPLGRYMATSPKSWETPSLDLQPGAVQKAVRQLSELSISLSEHATTLPSQYANDGQRNSEDKLTERRASCYGEFSLDETFQLSQNLIDIYPTIIDTLKKRHATRATSPKAPLNLDQSSILLLLSCHLRLIEIYEELSPHMEVCISQKGNAYDAPPPQQKLDKAPFSQFGGFQPPSSSTVSMQMMLLVQLAKKLLDCAAELAKVTQGLKDLEGKDDAGAGAAARAAARADMGSVSLDISVVTAENVRGRASNMAQQLGTLRDLMLQMGMFA